MGMEMTWLYFFEDFPNYNPQSKEAIYTNTGTFQCYAIIQSIIYQVDGPNVPLGTSNGTPFAS